MKHLKKLFALLLVLATLISSVGAYAAESEIRFLGLAEGFAFAPGSVYTDSDLFQSFKNVMPGDSLSENIRLTNEAKDCDYVKFYMRAEMHDAENPLESITNETAETANDFLSQLSMRVYNGEELIYEASPNLEAQLTDFVYLGTLFTGESLSLKAELDIPIALGNDYMHRLGEVDWVFLAEGFSYEKLTVHKVWDDNGYPERPESVKVQLLKNGEKAEEIVLSEENQWTYTWDQLDEMAEWSVLEEVPEGYEASYTEKDGCIFITNYMDYEPPVIPEPIDLTVKKRWSGDEDKDTRPSSVSVTLYQNGNAIDKVVLSEDNDWQYTWEDLDGDGDYSVIETGIPAGYAPTYREDNGVITITNHYRLIQTGQENLPIILFAAAGMLLILLGIFMMKRKNEKDQVK
ncbi:MAG: Cna B-type domain-containing protein [Christensenellaceae bacterium]|nr:Cna B-type domain-containing protein [Christensenellaceae bacterium]